MATALTVVSPTRDGVAEPVAVAADTAEGNVVPNTRGLLLAIENTDAASHTVTFTTSATLGGYEVADPQVTIAAGETLYFAGFATNVFGGELLLTADDATVMVSAFDVP